MGRTLFSFANRRRAVRHRLSLKRMVPLKYPLDPLIRLRETQVGQATRDLADAVGERAAAEARVRAAEEARLDAERAATVVRAIEREALDRGDLAAADLARTNAWEARVREERETLEGLTRKTEAAAVTAQGSETAARAEVARREADAQVIGKDREKWQSANDRAAEAREQENAAEAWRPRRA